MCKLLFIILLTNKQMKRNYQSEIQYRFYRYKHKLVLNHLPVNDVSAIFVATTHFLNPSLDF